MTIKEKSIRWWAEKTKSSRYVVRSGDFEDQRERAFLKKEGYVDSLNRRYWILKRPEEKIEEVFPLLYWKIMKEIISDNTGSLKGISAMQVLTGDQAVQKRLLVRTKEKISQDIPLPLEIKVTLRQDPLFDLRLIKKVQVAGVDIPVDIPERVLADISNLHFEEIRSFIAGTDFDERMLEAVYARNPKPVVFKRLVGLAKKAGRLDLVATLEKIIEAYTHYHVVKKEKLDTSQLAKKPQVISPAWVIRQEEQFKVFEATLEKELKSKIARIKKQPLSDLLASAREHKKYDTYHSTTLEGYQITPEQVNALLSGIIPEEESGGDYLEKLRNRMAIVGYSEAFDFILKKVQDDFGKPQANEKLIKDTYYNLFKPSVDAEILDIVSLTTYRNIAAFIRGTTYVPSSWEKLPDLMPSYAELVGEVENPVVKAILAHYFFVAIHPYIDGNGRTARLLMNYALLTSGYSWITIRAEQRSQYFGALNKGTVDGDILPFGKFIVEMLKEASLA